MATWLSNEKLFRDRRDAGRKLAARLRAYGAERPIVLGLPRGGVPVAYEVARELDAPLDVCVVRKLGAPSEPELGIGAVAEDGVIWLNEEVRALVGVSDAQLSKLITSQRREVDERVRRLRRGAPPVDVTNRTVLVVDDGVATGGTARAAIETLRERGARRVVFAVPVGAADTIAELSELADEVVCPHAEAAFYAVGQWYEDFSATSDEEVVTLLDRARARTEGIAPLSERAPTHENVRIRIGDRVLEGRLSTPASARGLVLFAHGSGSGRHSPRNQYVAAQLQRRGLATLLFDLLTQEEETLDAITGHLRFDIGLLASRLVSATEWARREPATRTLDIGYFGASTGAAAALIAAAERPSWIRAVVSRGGRPDLADDALEHVRAPTLLIVGGADREVEALNRHALARLECEKELAIVPRATHLFPEPGALEAVAELAGAWFVEHLGEQVRPAPTAHP